MIATPILRRFKMIWSPTPQDRTLNNACSLYGEVSAPKRWEDTIAPWFESMGFKRGENERSCVYPEEKDLLILLYVADCLADGDAADVQWIFTELEKDSSARANT